MIRIIYYMTLPENPEIDTAFVSSSCFEAVQLSMLLLLYGWENIKWSAYSMTYSKIDR